MSTALGIGGIVVLVIVGLAGLAVLSAIAKGFSR
jgi:hypothetical protein